MITIIANICGVIGWFLLVRSYHKNSVNKILLVQILSSLFYSINYFLLGAWTGFLVCLIGLIKEYLYYKTDLDDYIFIALLFVYVIIAYLTYNGWYTLLPILGTIIDGYALTKNRKVVTFGAIATYSLWVGYDIIMHSYACAITDGILIISNISILLIGYSRIIKSKKVLLTKCLVLSKNLSNYIYDLDKKLLDEKYVWDKDYQKLIFNKNNDSIFILKDKNKVLGYINYLCISEKEYNGIKNSEVYIKKYNDNEIIKYNKSKNNYVIIERISIDPKYQNYLIIKMIKDKFTRFIKDKYKNGYKIKSILMIPKTEFEHDLIDNSSFNIVKKYKTNEDLYELNSDYINNYIVTKEFKKEVKDSEYKIYSNDKITYELLESIYELDSKYFKKEYLWDIDYQKDVYNRNKNSIIAITHKDKLVGYINYLCINKNRYDYIKEAHRIIDDYELVDIKEYVKSKKNYITINSVVIDEKYRDSNIIKMLNDNMKKELKKLDKSGFLIGGINGTAISKDGRKFLEQLGFKKLKKLSDNNNLYILEKYDLKDYLYK